jgi:hypothetical protein
VVREPDAATQLTLQNNQLTSERGILSLKPDLRLERRGQHGRAARSFRQLRRFHYIINPDKVFGTHRVNYFHAVLAELRSCTYPKVW